MGIALTTENYYSKDADRDYMSVSQFKDFAGTMTHGSCEMAAYKNAMGILPKTTTQSMLVGSYVDAYFEGSLDKFKDEHKDEICTKASIKKFEEGKGPLELLADFRKADNIIARLKEDPVFMDYCSGDTQTIMTGSLFGIDWKIRMDFYRPGERIADLKVMKDMKPVWSPMLGGKCDFIRHWGYDIQGAVYQKIVEINTGMRLPFFICCATKEDVMDYDVIQVTQEYLDTALAFVERNLPHVLDVKNGISAPVACGTCLSCRTSKKLIAPKTIGEIIPTNPNAPDFGDSSDFEPAGAPSGLWDNF